jgi:hypothetical protein
MKTIFANALENMFATKIKAVDLQESDCKKVWQYDGDWYGLVEFRPLQILSKGLDGVRILAKCPDPAVRRKYILTLPLNEEITLLKKRRGLR